MDLLNLNFETEQQNSEKLFTLTGDERHWHILSGGFKYESVCKNKAMKELFNYFSKKNGTNFEITVPTFHEFSLSTQWEAPSRIIVAPTSDVFHPLVNDQKIFKVFNFIEKNPQHKFFIITQYAERMSLWVKRVKEQDKFKLENLAVGACCENQAQYNKSVYALIQTNAAMRFIFLDPFTERMKIDAVQIQSKDVIWPLSGMLQNYLGEIDGKMMWESLDKPITIFKKIDWVLSCGEFGSSSNPIHPAWIKGVYKSCQYEDVPFYFRSWGSLKPIANPDLANDEALVILSADGFIRGKGVGSRTNFLATFTSEDSRDIYMTRKASLEEIIPPDFQKLPSFFTKQFKQTAQRSITDYLR